MRILDLFSGAGGAAAGYHRAFPDAEIVGVDINPQPRYPFTFVQRDVMALRDFHFRQFDLIHASPPCQTHSAMSACRPGLAAKYPALIEPVRTRLTALGVPWVIENVEGAPVAGADELFGAFGVTLCGRMFGLELYRHRLFESNFPIVAPGHPWHVVPASKAGHWREGTVISVSGDSSPIAVARTAMGIDWMNRNELAESIPPAYTEWIGNQLKVAA